MHGHIEDFKGPYEDYQACAQTPVPATAKARK